MDEPTTPAETVYQLHVTRALHVSDVESPGDPVVEVLVRWGSAVVHVAHLAPGRDFVLAAEEAPASRTPARAAACGASALAAMLALGALFGEEPALGAFGALTLVAGLFVAYQLERARAQRAEDPARFAVPGAMLGGAGEVCVVASGRTRARLVPAPGAPAVVLDADAGAEGTAHFGAITVSARWVARPRALPAARERDRAAVRSFALAAVLVGGLVSGSLWAASASGGGGDDDDHDAGRAMIARDEYDDRIEDLRDRAVRARGDYEEVGDDDEQTAAASDTRPWWER